MTKSTNAQTLINSLIEARNLVQDAINATNDENQRGRLYFLFDSIVAEGKHISELDSCSVDDDFRFLFGPVVESK